MKHIWQQIILIACLGLFFSFGVAQFADVQMTPEEARIAALQSHYEWDAWHNTPKSIRDSNFYGIAEWWHKARAKGKYTTGEPLLMRTLRPEESFFETDEIREMCLQSKHYVAMQEYSDYSRAQYEAKGVSYTGPEAYIEQGIDFCRSDLKGRDEYAVPILDMNRQVIHTAFVDVASGLGGGGAIDMISAPEVQQLVGSSVTPQYVSFSIPAESPNDLKGHENFSFSFWLVDEYAVDPKGDAIFQVVDLQDQPVHLLRGEVQPIVTLVDFVGMRGEDVKPKLIYPVRLELIRINASN